MKKTIKEKHSKKWKHLSLERVWSEFGESLEIFLSSPHERWNKKNIWAWSEFGESLKNLQSHSSFPKKQWNNKKQWKHMSLERAWRISKLTPNSQRNLCLISFFKKMFFFKKKNIFLSLERVWRFSKLIFPLFFKKTFFFEKLYQTKISLWVWSEFGESLENLQTHSKLTKKSLLDVFFF